MAAAHELRLLGHDVTILEKGHFLGGLNTTGVAPYKMKSDRSLNEVEWILSIGGINIESGVSVPQDKTWADLQSEYDAIFVGFGLGPDSMMDLPGGNAQGIHGAVDYISRFKLCEEDLSGVQRAVVVGGGNTALDAVRELKGLGVPEVTLAYRGDEAKMSGYQHEWAEAKKEGIAASWRSQPIGFTEDGVKVTGVLCQRMDENKKPIDGDTFELPADLVLIAIGQGKLGELMADLPDVKVDWGKIVTDEYGATGQAGVYAGGDCRNGGKEVVNAAAEGKVAANAIHDYIMGA